VCKYLLHFLVFFHFSFFIASKLCITIDLLSKYKIFFLIELFDLKSCKERKKKDSVYLLLFSISAFNWSGLAPTTRWISLPFLKKINVGIASILNSCDKASDWSTSHLRKTTVSLKSLVLHSSIFGPIRTHGPHQLLKKRIVLKTKTKDEIYVAKKSTTTNLSWCWENVDSSSSVVVIILTMIEIILVKKKLQCNLCKILYLQRLFIQVVSRFFLSHFFSLEEKKTREK